MRLTILLLTFCMLKASATGYGQRLSVAYNNTPLNRVFKDITEKTGYLFFYSFVENDPPRNVTYTKTNGTLEDVLNACFKGQPYRYQVIEKTVVVKYNPAQKETPALEPPRFHDVKGKIVNDKGEPVPGATITVKGTRTVVTANANGEFALVGIAPDAVLVVSGAELETQEISVAGKQWMEINAIARVSEIDQVLVRAYGTVSRRLNTGNIAKVTSKEIENQPVSNILSALQGRIPGLLITQQNGLTGGNFTIRVRGQNSILQGSEPLFIVDGIPIAAEDKSINSLANATGSGGLSYLSLLNTNLIESVEVLKDAEATAIYGSRGANGVILITTKSGTSGRVKVNASFFSGTSFITKYVRMLTTAQYLEMRKEAFRNDGVAPTIVTAPDLLVFDSTLYTDFQELFLDHANTQAANFSLSGGSENLRFNFSTNYRNESNLFPGEFTNKQFGGNASLSFKSKNNKFSLSTNLIYTFTNNNLTNFSPTGDIILPPNLRLYDSTGAINWQEGGYSFRDLGIIRNPVAELNRRYNGQFDNFISNLTVSYNPFAALFLRISGGINLTQSNERNVNPSTALDPASPDLPSSAFSSITRKGNIIEPVIEYKIHKKNNSISLLAGGTIQNKVTRGNVLSGTNYANDQMLYSIAGAGNIAASTPFFEYRYIAGYARVEYNHKNRYLANFSGRRDGSSRFGPDNRFNNFGAVSVGWIFTEEGFLQKLGFLSFGKIRASYGVTGNDQIGDYKYLDSWSPTNPTQYQGVGAIRPTQLFNPNFAWERNRKLEVGLELAFVENRYLFSGVFFRNRSGNQLVNYPLPVQTGFISILDNIDALVENKGWEFSISGLMLDNRRIKWRSQANMTLPKNTLLEYPGLAVSSYANTYVIGQPLSVMKVYEYLGVDRATGLFSFTDQDQDGTFNNNDRILIRNTDPKFFGGLSNTLSFENWTLDIFLEFRKQTGINYLAELETSPGGFRNQPDFVLNRWQKPGDYADVQRFSATDNQALATIERLRLSTGSYSDASFIRLRNVSLSWKIPEKLTKRWVFFKADVFARAQNLLTITSYKGGDPEIQTMYSVPPLKTIVLGCSLSF